MHFYDERYARQQILNAKIHSHLVTMAAKHTVKYLHDHTMDKRIVVALNEILVHNPSNSKCAK